MTSLSDEQIRRLRQVILDELNRQIRQRQRQRRTTTTVAETTADTTTTKLAVTSAAVTTAAVEVSLTQRIHRNGCRNRCGDDRRNGCRTVALIVCLMPLVVITGLVNVRPNMYDIDGCKWLKFA